VGINEDNNLYTDISDLEVIVISIKLLSFAIRGAVSTNVLSTFIPFIGVKTGGSISQKGLYLNFNLLFSGKADVDSFK
jgi:hypothetical protein